MELEELEKLKKCDKEDDLIERAEEIGDKIIFRGYSQEQVICIVKELVKINLLSVKYETREEILSVLCDATANYNIKDQIGWRNIFPGYQRKNTVRAVFHVQIKVYGVF